MQKLPKSKRKTEGGNRFSWTRIKNYTYALSGCARNLNQPRYYAPVAVLYSCGYPDGSYDHFHARLAHNFVFPRDTSSCLFRSPPVNSPNTRRVDWDTRKPRQYRNEKTQPTAQSTIPLSIHYCSLSGSGEALRPQAKISWRSSLHSPKPSREIKLIREA